MYNSNSPASNRPARQRPSARLTLHHLERELPRLTAAVALIMDEHPTEKGVIHAHSYRIASYLHRHLPAAARERLVTHFDSSGRDAALVSHVTSPDATVLLTPSMTEGIDLADDLEIGRASCRERVER